MSEIVDAANSAINLADDSVDSFLDVVSKGEDAAHAAVVASADLADDALVQAIARVRQAKDAFADALRGVIAIADKAPLP